MENLLLVFLNELENINEFNDVINKFAENNYLIYCLDNIKDDEYFSADSLPEFVEFYKEHHKNANKIVVLSNSRDLIFSWYRCYNSVVDDFIYFIDKNNKNYFPEKERHYDFYKNLSDFNSIETESITGKIFFNIGFNNYEIIDFLIKDNRFKYFDSLDRYDFSKEKLNKLSILKKYLSNGYEYIFGTKDNNKIEIINMQNLSKLEYEIDDKFIKSILDNIYLIPYITVLFCKNKEQMLADILLIIYRELKEIDKEIQKYIFEKLYLYINSNIVDFKEKIYISSLIVMINNGDERLTELMMKTLLEDEESIEYHYEIVANILFYQSRENLNIHYEYYSNLRSEIEKLARWIFKGFNIKRNKVQNNGKSIAIIVDQLLSLNHSPTKLMLDYAKNIKKYYPEYSIKIFVEDNLYCKNELGIIPYLYTSAISKSVEQYHRDYLNKELIEVSYSNVHLSKKDRTIKLIRELEEFNPDAILTNSDISLVSRIFYNIYPIIYISTGGDYFSNLADAYLCVSKERVIEENCKYNLFDEKCLYEFKTGLEFVNPKKNIKRTDYNIDKNDFVMITVGNRLDAEIDEEFIDYVVNFLIESKDVKWLIVGPKEVSHLENKYKDLFNNQIISIQYESDLPALYRICDVYINPRRKGGGISIAMAMNEGLPIVLTRDSTDGVYYVGMENATGNSMYEYCEKLNRIYINVDERRKMGRRMVERIMNYNYKEFTDNIVNLIDIVSK